MLTFYSLLIAFFLCATSIWLLAPLARRIGLTDLPSERKTHLNEVPLIGGIAILLSFGFALLTLDISLAEFRSLIAVAVILTFIGILDDFHELKPQAKLFAQVIAGILTASWGHNHLDSLGEIFFTKPLILDNWSIPLTVIAVVGIINAFNMIDGVDGLASGIGIISIGFLAYFAYIAEKTSSLAVLLVFGSSLLSFLCFNFPLKRRKHISVFLGDAGSMLLGFFLVWFFISLSQGNSPAARPIDMLWIVALPVYDVAGVVMRRILQRRSPFRADRNHIHHLLLDYLKSPWQVCLIMYGLSLVTGLVAILGAYYKVSEGRLFTGFFLVFICYLIINRQLWKKLQHK